MIKQVGHSNGKNTVSINLNNIICSENLITVSVADKKIANQEALRVLIFSLKQYSPNFLNNFYFLYPKGEIEIDFIKSMSSLGVKSIEYDLDRQGDPYRTKFLLCSFLKEWQNPKGYCLYLDPDHIALNQPRLVPPKERLFVSSETKILNDKKPDLFEELEGIHYNNSIILGNIGMWRKVLLRWEDNYKNLTSIIPKRCLEEISFSLAAKQSKILISPIDPILQSNFACFNESCSLFHYGGDYPISIQIKKILESRKDIYTKLEKLKQISIKHMESWILNAILNIISNYREDLC